MAEDPRLPQGNFTNPENSGQKSDVFIGQDYRVWDSPGIPNVGSPAVPGRTGVVRADLTRQYVSSHPNQFYLNLVRVLSFAIDDISADFGDDIYNRFLFDAIVSSCIISLKAAVLEDGLTLRPAITDSDNPTYTQATKILDDAEDMFDMYPGHLDDWLWEMTDATWRGNTASEVTYRLDKTFTGKTQLFLDRLASKPTHSYGYAVDIYNNIVGIMSLIPGIGMPVYVGNIVVEPQRQPNMLPRDKFVLYAHRPRNENPLGTSILRPTYTAWNLKMQLIPEYAKYLRQFGSPSILGFSPPEAMALTLTDAQGIPLQGSSGPLTANSPEQALLNTLVNVQNGSAGVFPNGTEVKWIEMRGQGNPILQAFRWLDEQIVTSIKGQTMTSMTQAHGTQALGTVQRTTLDTLVRQIKATVARVILRDILRKWVRYNYGQKYERLAPHPELGHTEEQDIPNKLTAYAAAGYTFDPSQFQGIDESLGMPVRAANWQDLNLQHIADEAQAKAKAQPKPTPAPAVSAPGQPTKPPAQTPPAEAAHARRQILSDERWHEAVQLGDELFRRTGVRLIDPATPPPTMEEAEQLGKIAELVGV